MIIKIGIIGLGFVGSAMYESFLKKKISKNSILIYDKYKKGGIGNFEDCLNSKILFLALPTIFSEKSMEYDKSSIEETCEKLANNKYRGIVVIKSTLEPEVSEYLAKKYNLKIVHNPEFLSAKTALFDFHNQKHIVLGITSKCSFNKINLLTKFYEKYYPVAEISVCTSKESESMKIFCNCFYSVKIQFFTELFLLCQKNGTDFNVVKSLMLKNNWINPMHTQVPGPDGKISYGGFCFPKDTNALNQYMIRKNVLNNILNSCINERNLIREDKLNIKEI